MADAAFMDAIRPKAHRTKAARAKVRRELKARARSVDDLILNPPAAMQGLSIERTLLMIHRLGPHKVVRVLEMARVNRSRKLGALTDRQRRELLQVLDEFTPFVFGKPGRGW